MRRGGSGTVGRSGICRTGVDMLAGSYDLYDHRGFTLVGCAKSKWDKVCLEVDPTIAPRPGLVAKAILAKIRRLARQSPDLGKAGRLDLDEPIEALRKIGGAP